eukprot:Gb_02173 [translate_table: standard]
MGKLDSMEKQPQPPPPQQQQQPQSQQQQQAAAAAAAAAAAQRANGENCTNAFSKTPERIKRDEWSEGAVTSLLDSYENKWLLRNRAKLKGNDWEDVARHVSTRSDGTKSVKTQTQCKNKIESMKKRYRAEAASNCNNSGSGPSSWPLYNRMDGLLRCRTAVQPLQARPATCVNNAAALTDLGLLHETVANGNANANGRPNLDDQLQHPVPEAEGHTQDSNQEDGSNTLPNRKESAALDTDTSTPRSKIANAGEGSGKGNSCKRRKNSSSEVAESIRSFADSILKLEQAKIKMYKDSERLRAETEVRRGEMELKRTEIIAKTQLQIAKLLSGKTGKRKFADRNPSLRSTLALTAAPPEAAASHPLMQE